MTFHRLRAAVPLMLGAVFAAQIFTMPLFTVEAAADPIRIGVGIDAAYAPFFVANQRGLFKKAGLDVTLVRFAQGGEAVDAVIAGQAEFSAAADQTTLIRMARGPLQPLAIYEESGSYIKLVGGKNVNAVADIKKFGIVKGTVSEYSAGMSLKKFGIDPKTVQFIPAGPPELPALLVRGDIDGYFAWEPWPAMGVKQGGKVLMTSGDVGYSYTMWLTVSQPWLAKNEAAAKTLVGVIAEADKQISADPAKAAEDLQTQTKLAAADTIGFLQSTSFKVRDFTDQDLTGFEGIAAFLADNKATPTKLDVRAMVKPGFFKE